MSIDQHVAARRKRPHLDDLGCDPVVRDESKLSRDVRAVEDREDRNGQRTWLTAEVPREVGSDDPAVRSWVVRVGEPKQFNR